MYRRIGLRILRWSFVTVGIAVLTSVSIDATTNFRSSQSALALLTDRALAPECREGTARVSVGNAVWCVDIFPAAPGEQCPHQKVGSPRDTTDNVAASGCQPVVSANRLPWLYVAQHHAAQICAKASKQLLPPEVWYKAALGTPNDDACHVAGAAVRENQVSACESGAGQYDMVGNVWEWVDAEVVDGQYQGATSVPDAGYVQAVDRSGWPTKTGSTTNDLFQDDYFWSEADGVYGVMRGGFYRARDDAGVYTVHAGVDPSFSSNATGVRCGYRLP